MFRYSLPLFFIIDYIHHHDWNIYTSPTCDIRHNDYIICIRIVCDFCFVFGVFDKSILFDFHHQMTFDSSFMTENVVIAFYYTIRKPLMFRLMNNIISEKKTSSSTSFRKVISKKLKTAFNWLDFFSAGANLIEFQYKNKKLPMSTMLLMEFLIC